jgi:hypothetical protein
MKGFYEGYPYYWDSGQHCFVGATLSQGPCDGGEYAFAEGIGQVYSRTGSASCFTIYNLVYYSKGNETWGTPHNWSVILSDKEIATQMQTGMTLFPNPAEDILNAQVPDKNATKATYRIYSISGQLISQAQGDVSAGSLQIPVNQMENGLYLLEVETENGIWTGRFAK